jgi:phosphoserine aminotransferase
MFERAFNFSAGPAALPLEVLQQAAEEMTNFRGSGMSVMEMSHRGPEFMQIAEQAQADLRELMQIPKEYAVLFLQGGGLGENAIVPLNLMGPRAQADYLVTGSWSEKSAQEASRYGNVALVAPVSKPFTTVAAPDTWTCSPQASYFHLCTNETIDGIEIGDVPFEAIPPGVPVVADVSSHILSRPMPIERYGVLYGGAQKNIGPAGLTLVIIRHDLLGRASPVCPSVFNYQVVDQADSMFNTPPTFAIYIAGLVFQWLKRQGGLKVIEARNLAKAQRLYEHLDRGGLFFSRVDPRYRSRMNVTFFMRDEALYDPFLAQAKAQGMVQLKGHRSVGGLRASIYNAVPMQAVETLVQFMAEFERTHG